MSSGSMLLRRRAVVWLVSPSCVRQCRRDPLSCRACRASKNKFTRFGTKFGYIPCQILAFTSQSDTYGPWGLLSEYVKAWDFDFLRWLGVEDVVRWTSHVEAGTTTRRLSEPAPFVAQRKVRYFRCSVFHKEGWAASSRGLGRGRGMEAGVWLGRGLHVGLGTWPSSPA